MCSAWKWQKVAIWGKNLTFKIIAIRQNGIPCCTRTRDQKTEFISTALQKLDKIFVEILFHNVYKSPCCDYCCRQKYKSRHLEDPWYVLYLSTKYLEPSFKKILTAFLPMPTGGKITLIFIWKIVLFWRLFRSDLPAWGYQYLGQWIEVCLTRH